MTDAERLNQLSKWIVKLCDKLSLEGMDEYKRCAKQVVAKLETATWTSVRKAVKFNPQYRDVGTESQHLGNTMSRIVTAQMREEKCNRIKQDCHAALETTIPETSTITSVTNGADRQA